jgi:hypothetical protein
MVKWDFQHSPPRLKLWADGGYQGKLIDRVKDNLNITLDTIVRDL